MIEDAEIKKGLVVYHYRDIDSCIEKGIISDAKFYDICRRDFYLRCVTQINWVAYVDKAGNEIDSEHFMSYSSDARLGDLYLTAKEAYDEKNAEINDCLQRWNDQTSTLRGLLRFPLYNDIAFENGSYHAREFYENKIEEYLKNNK